MTGASGEEGLLIREMTVHSKPLDSGLFGNRADAGACWSKRFMQMHGSLDNALARLILLLRASFELICSCHRSLERNRDVQIAVFRLVSSRCLQFTILFNECQRRFACGRWISLNR